MLSLVIVAILGISHALPARLSSEPARIAQLTAKEEDCIAKGKFYSELTDKCHELLGTGPCEDDERFVLRKRQEGEDELVLKAICVKSKCGDRKYWPETDSCVSQSDKVQLCGNSSKVVLTDNYFGEGECSCAKVPPHARLNDDPNNECFELYQRGPCRRGQILAVPEGSFTPKCVQDPCALETLELRRGDPGSRRTMVYFQDGCYELEKSGGPCPNNGTLKISVTPWSYKPQCENLGNWIPSPYQCNGKPCGNRSKVNNTKEHFAAFVNAV